MPRRRWRRPVLSASVSTTVFDIPRTGTRRPGQEDRKGVVELADDDARTKAGIQAIARAQSQCCRRKTRSAALTRAGQDGCIPHLVRHEATVLQPEQQELCQLWRSRNYRVRTLAGLPQFPGGYGAKAGRHDHRANRRHEGLFAGELPLGDRRRAECESRAAGPEQCAPEAHAGRRGLDPVGRRRADPCGHGRAAWRVQADRLARCARAFLGLTAWHYPPSGAAGVLS